MVSTRLLAKIPTGLSIMSSCLKSVVVAFVATLISAHAVAAGSAEVDSDALSLEGGTGSSESPGNAAVKIFFEGAIGTAAQRYLPNNLNVRRGTLDFS